MVQSVTSEEKLFAALCHIGVLISLPVILPVIIYLLKKDSDFVRHHAAEAIAFQIGLLVVGFVCLLLVFILIGIPMLLIVVLYAVIMSVIGILRAVDGKTIRFPLTTQFARKL